MPKTNKPAKKEIPFIEILKQAAQIVWRNKFLLWFGVLMALGSPESFTIGDSDNWNEQSKKIETFLETHWQIVLIIVFVLFAVGAILFLISLIGKAGLIKSVNLIAQDKKTTFWAGWQEGKKYLWRLLGLFFLLFFAIIIIVSVLAFPVIYLIIAGSWIGAVLIGLLAVAIFIPLIFILALTNIFAEFYIILSDLKIWSAVEAGYNLLLKNILNSIVFGLLLMVVNLAAMLILLPVAAMALLIFIPAGVISYYLNKIIFGGFLAMAILMFLAAILFISSIFITYKTTAWTLFFREIAKVEKTESEKVPEAEKEEEIAAATEKA